MATGHWGCGAYGNNHNLMFLKQWLAASEAGATVHTGAGVTALHRDVRGRVTGVQGRLRGSGEFTARAGITDGMRLVGFQGKELPLWEFKSRCIPAPGSAFACNLLRRPPARSPVRGVPASGSVPPSPLPPARSRNLEALRGKQPRPWQFTFQVRPAARVSPHPTRAIPRR